MKKVLLVHGILMGAWSMFSLSKYLRKEGYEVEFFDYPLFPLETDLHRAFLEKAHTFKPDIIIGHSLGGNIAVSHLRRLNKNLETILCLGSPLRGSAIAKALSSSFLAFAISSSAKEFLLHVRVIPKSTVRVGMIAGTNNYFGFGIVVRVLHGPSDGTVEVEETKVRGLADRVEINVGHTALLFSESVREQILHFLSHGVFLRSERI